MKYTTVKLTEDQLRHLILVLNRDNARLAIDERFQDKKFQRAWSYNLRLSDKLTAELVK